MFGNYQDAVFPMGAKTLIGVILKGNDKQHILDLLKFTLWKIKSKMEINSLSSGKTEDETEN